MLIALQIKRKLEAEKAKSSGDGGQGLKVERMSEEETPSQRYQLDIKANASKTYNLKNEVVSESKKGRFEKTKLYQNQAQKEELEELRVDKEEEAQGEEEENDDDDDAVNKEIGKGETAKIEDESNPCIRTLKHNSEITAVALSPDNNLIATCSSDGASVWHIDKRDRRIFSREQKVSSIALSDKYLMYALRGVIKVIRLSDWKECRSIKAHGEIITTLEFSPDNTMLASGSKDQSIKLWDCLADFRQHTSFALPISEGSNLPEVTSVSFPHDCNYLVSCSGDAQIRVWDIKTRQQIGQRKVDKVCLHVACSRSGDDQILVALQASIPRLYDRRDWSYRKLDVHHNEEGDIIQAVACSSTKIFCGVSTRFDNRRLGAVMIAPVSPRTKKAWRKRASFIVEWYDLEGNHKKTMRGHTSSIMSMKASLDGTLLVSGSSDHTARIWSLPA